MIYLKNCIVMTGRRAMMRFVRGLVWAISPLGAIRTMVNEWSKPKNYAGCWRNIAIALSGGRPILIL